MRKGRYLKNPKYQIVLFCNKKKVKVLYKCMTKNAVYEHWRQYRTQKPPRYLKIQSAQRKNESIFELALIFPNNRWAKTQYVKDSMGRNMEAKLENDKYRIKEIIPYWKEELIYDYQTKKRIRYHEFIKQFYNVDKIAQIFTLNNKIFLQIEEDIKLFGNKNLIDTERLFELLKEDLLKKNFSNFIFVKDITRHQRSILYKLLISKGFKREHLFRHYSY